jgi:hypothetical protein
MLHDKDLAGAQAPANNGAHGGRLQERVEDEAEACHEDFLPG